MGDRSYGFNTVEAPFLGEPARFPYGAFHMAASAECPVVILLTAKLSTRRYLAEIADVVHPRYAKGSNSHYGARRARRARPTLRNPPFSWAFW